MMDLSKLGKMIGEVVSGKRKLTQEIEAAKRSRLKEIPLIVRNLDDENMMKFMGRENLEDYNADFFVMFETYQAARKYLDGACVHAPLETSVACRHAEGESTKPTAAETAKLLGWTRTWKTTTLTSSS